MTQTRNAQTAALEALIEAHAIELKLPTVRRRYRALAQEATRAQQTPVAYLGALLEAEMTERAERREKRRLIDARFPQIKRLEDFRFADNPKISQATIAALAEGSWIDDRESVIFIGDSGTGKTMLATALTSSTPATSARASATAWSAKPGNEPDPPARKPRTRLSPLPSPLGARLRDDSRVFPSPGRSGNINTTNNRRQAEPLQATAPG